MFRILFIHRNSDLVTALLAYRKTVADIRAHKRFDESATYENEERGMLWKVENALNRPDLKDYNKTEELQMSYRYTVAVTRDEILLYVPEITINTFE